MNDQQKLNFHAVEIPPTKPFAIFSRITGKQVATVDAVDKHEAVEIYLKQQKDA